MRIYLWVRMHVCVYVRMYVDLRTGIAGGGIQSVKKERERERVRERKRCLRGGVNDG